MHLWELPLSPSWYLLLFVFSKWFKAKGADRNRLLIMGVIRVSPGLTLLLYLQIHLLLDYFQI